MSYKLVSSESLKKQKVSYEHYITQINERSLCDHNGNSGVQVLEQEVTSLSHVFKIRATLIYSLVY